MSGVDRLRRDVYRSLVGFIVGRIRYAVPTVCVRAVAPPSPLVTLPHLPPGVIGVFEHRGQVIPVIDLRISFDASAEDRNARSQWIIVEVDRQKIGLAAKRVTGVFEVGFGGLRQVPELGHGTEPQNLVGVATQEDELTFVLDVAAFHAYVLDVDLPKLPPAP